MLTFTFTGQSIEDWPAWLRFCNFATNGQYIIIHTLEDKLCVNLGDTLYRRPDGWMWIDRI